MSRPSVELDLEALIEAWRGPLVGLLAGWGASWDDARELAQDAFAEAWLGRARFLGDPDDPAVVGPWLAGIARNLLRAKRRRDGRRPRPLEAVDPPAGADDPAEERRRRVRDAIERLPGELRTVVRAFYLERASTTQVAALLGVSAKTVEGRLYRARAALREALGAPAEA